MAMNIFEGGRRITHVLAVVLVLALGIWVLQTTPEPWSLITVEIARPGAAGKLVENCHSGNGHHYRMKEPLPSGRYDLTLCFPSISTRNGMPYVPIRLNPDGTYLTYPWISDEVSQYAKDVGEAYKVPPDILKIAEDKWRKSRNEAWWGSAQAFALGSAIGLAVLYGLAWVMGWVVRGFTGIHRGQDTASTPAPVEDKE